MEPRTVFEGAGADRGHALADEDVLQAIARVAQRQVRAERRQVLVQHEAHQSVASLEGAVADRRDTGGDDDLHQAGAVGERPRADVGDAVPKRQRRKAVAAFERAGADVADAVADDDLFKALDSLFLI